MGRFGGERPEKVSAKKRRRHGGCRGLSVLARVAGVAVLLTAGCRNAPRPDILLVTIDTLRADRLVAYGSSLRLTPELDALGRGATVFERAYSAAPITGPSLTAAFTSHYPHETKVTDNGLTVPDGVETLAERLRGLGYETAAVVSNPVLAWPNRLDSGFDRYDDELPQWDFLRGIPARRAPETTEAAVRMWRTRSRKPYFLWVHYMEPHGPYDAPPEFVEKADRVTPAADVCLPVNSTNRGFGGIPEYQYRPDCHRSRDYVVRYNASVARVDEQVGRLLRAPELQTLWKEGIICITADHGEALGEHDTWFAHGENVYEEMLRVPLILRAPGVKHGRRADLVSLIDLVPSMEELLGLSVESSNRGRPVFFRESADRVVLAETFPAASLAERYTAIGRGGSVIFSQPGGWEFFRSSDQAEDLATARPREMVSLARWLRSEILRNDMAGLVPEAPTRVLSDETIRRLRSLGYLD